MAQALPRRWHDSDLDERQKDALAHLDLSGFGLEIGGAYDPLLTDSVAANFDTLDHATREDLVDKYSSYGRTHEKIEQIQEVDFVWAGGSLVDAVETDPEVAMNPPTSAESPRRSSPGQR